MNEFDQIIKGIDILPDEEIWTLYAYLGLKLKERKLVITRNIVGERGEFLAIKIYNETPGLAKLQAAPEETQNVDALSRKGERYSIKTISDPGSLTGVFYGCGEQGGVIPEKTPVRLPGSDIVLILYSSPFLLRASTF